jgi:hypothetical protein
MDPRAPQTDARTDQKYSPLGSMQPLIRRLGSDDARFTNRAHDMQLNAPNDTNRDDAAASVEQFRGLAMLPRVLSSFELNGTSDRHGGRSVNYLTRPQHRGVCTFLVL